MAFDPKSISGLNVWLDASQLGLANGAAVSPWPDLSGNNRHGAIIGTPAPVVRYPGLSGLPVVRFRYNEGRVRGLSGLAAGAAGKNFTILYVGRVLGPIVGRVFSSDYPESNLCVGFSGSYDGVAFDHPPAVYMPASPATWLRMPSPWRMPTYASSFDGTNLSTALYLDKVYAGGITTGGNGLQTHYYLSGYDATLASETCDCEVAELLIYNRLLNTTERQNVESYLWAKWGLAVQPPFDPREMIGLNVWLDASALGSTYGSMPSWPDKSGNGRSATSTGSPFPAQAPATLDNKGVVRFSRSQAYYTGPTGLAAGAVGSANFSVFSVVRCVGPANSGRSFSSAAGQNFLCGIHQSTPDACYDNGWVSPIPGWGGVTLPTPWKVYDYVSSHNGTAQSGAFFVNGVATGTTTTGGGLGATYVLNEFSGAGETGDFQAAEYLLFNRPLVVAERRNIEFYLAAKWLNLIPMNKVSSFTIATATELNGGAGWYGIDNGPNVVVTPDWTYGPGGVPGGLIADKVAAGTGNQGHSIYWNYPHTDSTAITFSIYIKSAGRNNAMIYWHDINQWSQIDLLTGAATASNASVVTTLVESCPGGWWRFSSTVTKVGNVNPAVSLLFEGASTFAGDGVNGWYLCNASLTRSPQPSAIPFVRAAGTPAGSSVVAGEGAPSNIITYPSDFTNALWTKTNTIILPDVNTTPFTPKDVAGLNVWLDAEHVLLWNNDFSQVNVWPDLSGKGNDGLVGNAQDGAPSVIVNRANQRPVVRFRANQACIYANTGLDASGKNFSVFYVARVVGPTVGRVLMGFPTNFLLGYDTTAQQIAWDGQWMNSPGAAYDVVPTPWVVWGYTASYDGVFYLGYFYYQNFAVGNTASGVGLGTSCYLTGLGIPSDCEVAELVIYNRSVTAAERTQIYAYLKAKWGAV